MRQGEQASARRAKIVWSQAQAPGDGGRRREGARRLLGRLRRPESTHLASSARLKSLAVVLAHQPRPLCCSRTAWSAGTLALRLVECRNIVAGVIGSDQPAWPRRRLLSHADRASTGTLHTAHKRASSACPSVHASRPTPAVWSQGRRPSQQQVRPCKPGAAACCPAACTWRLLQSPLQAPPDRRRPRHWSLSALLPAAAAAALRAGAYSCPLSHSRKSTRQQP